MKFSNLKQGENESPQSFFNCIMITYEDAAYPNDHQDIMVQQVFLSGLQYPISLHLQSLPTMELKELVDTAENYWCAHYAPYPRYRGNYYDDQEETENFQPRPIQRKPSYAQNRQTQQDGYHPRQNF